MARPLGSWLAPPRFLAFVALLAGGLAGAVPALGWARGVLAAFDVAASVFVLSLAPLLRVRGEAAMRARAAANDANRALLLGVAVAASATVLVAVGAEISAPGPAAKALVIATLALAWLFANAVYALHYAHLYWSGEPGGLQFSGDEPPGYSDFLYFAVTLGMTFQTSDTAVTTAAMRRVVTGHSLAAFAFNVGVIAFTVNTLGGA